IKLFERDEKVLEEIALPKELADHIEAHVVDCEKELGDDAESIITNQRYSYITALVEKAIRKNRSGSALTASDKIDRVVTNRVLALPLFALIMYCVYYISMDSIGGFLTDWTNDELFGDDMIVGWVSGWLGSIGCAEWLQGLIVEGIVGGVGAVLGFVPQMLILFFMLAIL
ncbi:MAG: ferrous iron transport protein B, partial [Mailhella sp.]|nr:ferrous iron transport protein B [Mailhella sp.]